MVAEAGRSDWLYALFARDPEDSEFYLFSQWMGEDDLRKYCPKLVDGLRVYRRRRTYDEWVREW